MMTTTRAWLTETKSGVTVSTVRVTGDGRPYYLTAILLGGRASDGVRTTTVDAADRVHSDAADWAWGRVDVHSLSHDRWTARLADLREVA